MLLLAQVPKSMKADPSERTIAEEGFIDFKCPYCGNAISYPDKSRRKLEECLYCSEMIIVPEVSGGVGGKLAIPFKTSRLQLRRLVPADANDLFELMADEESFKYIGWNPLELDEVEDWIEKDRLARLTQGGSNLCLALEHLERQKVIGFFSLYYQDEDRQQMGFTTMIHRDYRRMGLGSEAVIGGTDLVFGCLNAHRLYVMCDTRNIAAARMLEKAGFRREAECIKGEFQKGEWINTFWYAQLKEEHRTAA